MAIRIRPRWPVLALLLLAPSIPELLTGSTPITNLVVDPPLFAIAFLGIVGLYGTGALLIREFAVYFRKGWASILLLGAAYGIAEEGLAVHTFFEPAGLSPVGTLGAYGHAFGVNWLWALGLTAFHAVYSISLPILLTRLWFPEVQNVRWLDRSGVAIVAAVYLGVVALFAFTVGHGPSPALLALFLGVEAVLIAAALVARPDLLAVRPGPARVRPLGLAVGGAIFFAGWVLVLVIAGAGARVPAPVTGVLFVATSLGALAVALRGAGRERLEWAEFYFATGMLGILFLWDVLIEFSVPGILGVSAVFIYFLYRLYRRMGARAPPPVPAGALPS